jgi:hypothetical protein
MSLPTRDTDRPHPAPPTSASTRPAAAAAVALVMAFAPSALAQTPSQAASQDASATGKETTPPDSPPEAAGEASVSHGAKPSSAVSVPVVDPEKTRRDKETELRRRFVPDAYTVAELDALSERLGMSEASRGAFVEVRAHYARLSESARDRSARSALQLLPAAFRYNPHETEFEPIHTPELLELYKRRDAVGEAIGLAETYLTEQLVNLADPAKRGALRLVRTARAETLHACPARLPGARVNLLDLLPKTGLAEAELLLLEPIVDRYADDYVRALEARHRDVSGIETRRAESLVALGPEWRAGRTLAEARGVERELASHDTAEVRSELPLRDLNAATLERIRKVLPPSQARRVLVAWQSIVHPELFEEDRMARIVMERFIGTPGVSSEGQSLAIDRFLQLEDQLWPLGQQVVELADSVVVAERLPPTDAAQVRIALEQQIHKIQIKRRKAVRDAVRELQGSVPAEASDFATTLQDTLATLDAQDRASSFLMGHLAQRQRELETLLAMGETPATAAQDAPAPGEDVDATTVPVGQPEGEAGDAAPVPPPPGAGVDQPSKDTPPSRSDRSSRGSRRRR